MKTTQLIRRRISQVATITVAFTINTVSLFAQDATTNAPDDAAELAKKLSNPVAALISVPLQNNFDFGGGPNGQGFRYTLNLQPVIPIALNTNWNLISRTILPFIHQDDMVGSGSQTGLGDITQSFFFSPVQPTTGGWIWGVGPAMLIPTATDDALGSGKFGLGPTMVLLKQSNGWTYGAMVNHIWSIAGNEDRETVCSTFLQPFVAYQTKTRTTFTLNTESSYDWQHSQWTVPLIGQVSQLVKIGKLPLNFQIGAKYYAEGPSGAPTWGLRCGITFLFPTK